MSYFSYDREEMARFVPSNCQRALEVGCAEGGFRRHFPAQCEYWGVEQSVDAADRASEVLDKVLASSFEDAAHQLPDAYFDVIICNDVIEHVADGSAFVSVLKTKLNADGVLIGSIPNVRFQKNLAELLLKKDWEYKDEGILDRTHLRFFTEKSLRRFLEECGLVIQDLRGINSFLKRKPTPRSLLRRFFVFLLGKDTQYRQFGFRAAKKS
jgi:2-polyprenyl-3-methyl-5-hydroxy-6-metoxy-1,4-benzoquinol methylase